MYTYICVYKMIFINLGKNIKRSRFNEFMRQLYMICKSSNNPFIGAKWHRILLRLHINHYKNNNINFFVLHLVSNVISLHSDYSIFNRMLNDNLTRIFLYYKINKIIGYALIRRKKYILICSSEYTTDRCTQNVSISHPAKYKKEVIIIFPPF